MSFLSSPSRTRGHPLQPLHREALLSHPGRRGGPPSRPRSPSANGRAAVLITAHAQAEGKTCSLLHIGPYGATSALAADLTIPDRDGGIRPTRWSPGGCHQAERGTFARRQGANQISPDSYARAIADTEGCRNKNVTQISQGRKPFPS
jgi:hypothetical protein